VPILLPEWRAGPVVDQDEEEDEGSFPDRSDFFPDISRLPAGDLEAVRAGLVRGWSLRLSLPDVHTRREVSYPARLELGAKAGAAVIRRYLVGTVIRTRSGPAARGWMWVRINVHRSRIVRDHRFEDSGPTVVAPEIEFESLWLSTVVRVGATSTVRAGEFNFTFTTTPQSPPLPFAVARATVMVRVPEPGILSDEEAEEEDVAERLVLLPPPAEDPGPILRVAPTNLTVDLARGGSLTYVAGRIRPVVVGREVEVAMEMSLSGVVVRDVFIGSTTVVTREAGGVRIRTVRGAALERPIRRLTHRRIDPDGDRLEPALLSDLRLTLSSTERFYPVGKTVSVVGK